MTQFIQIFR